MRKHLLIVNATLSFLIILILPLPCEATTVIVKEGDKETAKWEEPDGINQIKTIDAKGNVLSLKEDENKNSNLNIQLPARDNNETLFDSLWKKIPDSIKKNWDKLNSEERSDWLRKSAGTYDEVQAQKTAMENKKKDAFERAFADGVITNRDMEIYKFMQERWDYYERRDGEYLPEKHDDIVVGEASAKFDVPKAKLNKIVWEIGKAEAGIIREKIVLAKENVPVEIEIKTARLLPDNVIELTVENRTKKDMILPRMNLACYVFKNGEPVGYHSTGEYCPFTAWAENLGYQQTKKYETAPLRAFSFNAVKVTAYLNINEIKAAGLKSNIQESNDPGATVIPVCESKLFEL